ncbi:hypothetical protein Cs7R123_66920 [Catellatospora sp. TT07R-123]|nr:hypothetical protein Cs7R123_66920 [Catellatospora sp. TT07R-123]
MAVAPPAVGDRTDDVGGVDDEQGERCHADSVPRGGPGAGFDADRPGGWRGPPRLAAMERISRLWAAAVAGLLSTMLVPAVAWAEESGVAEEFKKRRGGFGFFGGGALCCLVVVALIVVGVVLVMKRRGR